jgi:hypothetical protein
MILKINKIELAEEIVNKYPSLSWDGWNIVWTTQDPSGYTDKNGIFKDGKWFIRQIFTVQDNGWVLPDKIMGS